MKRYKICFFCGDITRCGGTERVSTIIANGLTQIEKYHIVFLSIVEQNNSPFFPILPKIKRYVLKEDRKWMKPGLDYALLVPVLRRFLKKHDINIIIDIDIVLDVLSIPASVGIPVKVISWEHFHYHYEQKFLYRKMIARFSAYFSDYMITLTKQDKENYVERLHRSKGIEFIYNPIVISENSDNSKKKLKQRILITVGSLNERKGTDIIAELVPIILLRYRNWKWYFLGEGEHKRILERIICQYQLEDQLILTGNVINVEDFLNCAAIYVMPSRLEGFPMCLLEAKACHLPCIAFDIETGPSEIIQDKINGFLVPPFNLDLMMKKIELLIENEDLRNQFSRNTTIGIDKFELDSILREWENVLEKVLHFEK